MLGVDAVHPEEDLRADAVVQFARGLLAKHRQRLLVHRAAQLHDVDVLRLVQQYTQPQERRDDVQVMPHAHLDLLGEGVNGRSRGHDDRVGLAEHLHRTLGDAPLGVAIDVVLHVHVEVRNVGIGRTRAAVHLI